MCLELCREEESEEVECRVVERGFGERLRVLHHCLTEETINLFSASEHQQLHLPTLLLPFRVTGITMGILIGGCMKDEIVSSSAASPEIM